MTNNNYRLFLLNKHENRDYYLNILKAQRRSNRRRIDVHIPNVSNVVKSSLSGGSSLFDIKLNDEVDVLNIDQVKKVVDFLKPERPDSNWVKQEENLKRLRKNENPTDQQLKASRTRIVKQTYSRFHEQVWIKNDSWIRVEEILAWPPYSKKLDADLAKYEKPLLIKGYKVLKSKGRHIIKDGEVTEVD